jgi:cholesterol transport system auxiliary component
MIAPSRNILVLLVAASVLLITACSLPGPSARPAKQTFMLQGGPVSQHPEARISKPCVSLRVNLPGSAPGVNTVRMAYTTEPNRLDYFAYHEWVATPARMIASMMESRLDGLGLFSAVVLGSSDIKTDFRLDSEVQSLQQDFVKGSSTVNLTIKVTLIKVASRSLLNSKTFSYREPADGENAEAGVAAANRAAEHFLVDLTTFISESINPAFCKDSSS